MANNKRPDNGLYPPLEFNKRNVEAFADYLFSDKNGRVTFHKLCGYRLSNGKTGNSRLNCALGEAYITFINKNLGKFYNKSSSSSPTDNVMRALLNVARLKKVGSEEKLNKALDDVLSANEYASGETEDALFFDRAKAVANVFRKKVAPLLK